MTAPAAIRDAFEALVSGLDSPMFVVTAAARDERAGCLVGFATQASIEPPRLVVMLSKANRTFEVASAATLLGVHFLHHDNHDLARLFGHETGDAVDKFARCQWRPGPGGVPLVAGTRGWVVGQILARLDCGDHVAHLLAPVAAAAERAGPALDLHQAADIEPGHPA